MKRPLLRYDSVTAVAGHGFNMIFLENPGCAAADGLLIGIRTGVNVDKIRTRDHAAPGRSYNDHPHGRALIRSHRL